MASKSRPSWRQNSTPRPMPSTPLSTSLPTSSSSCSKLISLIDWWLIKSETNVDGKRLAVGGYLYSCEEKTMHIFTSAPVVKRLNHCTVETADGSTIRLQGGINRSRMQQNGFPTEVSECFFIGFPFNWEYYAKKDVDPIIPISATCPTSPIISNEVIFPVPVAFEFSLVKLINDCASNPELSVDDLLLKNLTSSPVNAESHNTLCISNDSVQSETISASEEHNDDVERCAHHECHELHKGVSSSQNENCSIQNESRQMLQIEYLSNKESEINNERLCSENTFNSVKTTDDFLNALSPEVLESLHTQQEENSAGKDPEVITRKTSSALEASSESPQACTQRNIDAESNPSSGVIPMDDRVGCEHLPISSSNVKCESQNESEEMLPTESLSNKGAEINNETLSFEKTVDSVNYIDSQQNDNSANKDSEFITRKKSSTLEALFESPQARGQRDTCTESNSHSGDKFSSTMSSPFVNSLLKQMMRRKRCGSKLNLESRAMRIRVNPPNDDSDVLNSTFNENDILPLNGKESKENDMKTSSTNASHVGKDNSDCDLGRARRCYMLSRDDKMDINSLNCEKNLKSEPLILSKFDNKESQNATRVDNLNQNMCANSSHDAGESTNLKDKCEGGQMLGSAMEVECEGTYIEDDTNKHANDIGNIKHCVNKMSAIDEDVLITQTKVFFKCRSDNSEVPSDAWTKNRDDTNGTLESKKNGGITNNQDENQAEVTQESKVSKLKKARNQVRVQSPNISEEMESPLARSKIEKQNAILSTSPELLNPKRSRSGRLLLPPINRWQREVVYDMDGSITNIANVDKLTSVTGRLPEGHQNLLKHNNYTKASSRTGEDDEQPSAKRGRGRPPKLGRPASAKSPVTDSGEKSGGGRPPKPKDPLVEAAESGAKRGRGRPPKAANGMPKPRGRPPKAVTKPTSGGDDGNVVVMPVSGAKRGRGRPPKAAKVGEFADVGFA